MGTRRMAEGCKTEQREFGNKRGGAEPTTPIRRLSSRTDFPALPSPVVGFGKQEVRKY